MNLLKFLKGTNNCVYAPVAGFCTDIGRCSDKTFSDKMLGDGFMIMPTDDFIYAPADGIITMIFPTLHAFGMKMDNGQELLIHIGINTVELNGEHFEQLCEVDENVLKGTPVIKFDYKKICKLGYDPSVLVIFIGRDNVEKTNLYKDVKTEDLIVKG